MLVELPWKPVDYCVECRYADPAIELFDHERKYSCRLTQAAWSHRGDPDRTPAANSCPFLESPAVVEVAKVKAVLESMPYMSPAGCRDILAALTEKEGK